MGAPDAPVEKVTVEDAGKSGGAIPEATHSGAGESEAQLEYGAAKLSSFGWAFIGRIVAQLTQIAGTIILGRIIAPDQFGVYAAATVIISLGQIFTDLGLGPAIVHRQVLDHTFLEAAFWLNAISGIVLSLLTLAVAWPLSFWYHFPQLIWVVPIEGLAFTFSISTVGLALMERRFEFKAIATAEFVAVLVGQAAAIVVAVFDPSVLALAIGPVVTAAALSVIILKVSGWHPRRPIRIAKSGVRELAGFASYLSIFNVTSFAARNSDDFLIGRYTSATALGFYSRSYQLMLLPITQVTQALSRALRPTFARAQNDRARLQDLHTKAEIAAAAIGFPAAAVLYSLAPSGIPFVLGPTWRPMIPLFQIFALSIPTQVLGSVNGSLYMATGHVRRLLATGATTSGLLVIAFVLAARFGTTAVAVTFAVHSLVTLPLGIYPILSKLKLSFWPAVPPIALIAALSAALLAALELLPDIAGLHHPSGLRLLTQVAIMFVLAVPLLIVGLRRYRSTNPAPAVRVGAA